MPRHCSVFGCRSNYDTETERTSTFSLPKDENLRKTWLRNIPTDFSKLKNPTICIKHFDESCIIRIDRVTTMKGELIEYHRKIPKLTENAMPTIFPNTPSYCSKTIPKVKRLADVEDEHLNQAIRESIVSNKQHMERDSISGTSDILSFLNARQIHCSKWTIIEDETKILICLLGINNGTPCVTSFITVNADLSFNVQMNNVYPINTLNTTKKLNSLHILDSIMSQIENGELVPTVRDKVDCAVQLLESLPNYDENEHLKFIVGQLNLSQAPKNNRFYDNKSMILASTLYVHSSSAYNALRKCDLLILPHPRTLQRLISSFELSSNSSSYLESRIKHLKPHELLVSLVMDEIYIQPQLSFKGGEIYGSSYSDAQKCAKTAQVFMVSSLLSKYVDVVAIIPVINMTSEQLKSFIADVLNMLERIGFQVISLIADNNIINRKAYELMTPNKTLQPSILHPLDSSRRLFFMFDTVHILKCIRNNWQTKRNVNKTLCYTDMNDPSKILCAQYRHLELVYEKEKECLVKYGHTLSAKVLYPSAIQKQNVGLALKIFNDNNIVALKHATKDLPNVSQQINETVIFLNVIVNWWKIVNVKSVFEGKRFNDPYREAIRSPTDMQVQFLNKMCHWLKIWRVSVPIINALTAQTFQSLITTLESLLEIIPYLFDKYRVDYILLSKFQSDNLESRFGCYRQLSGANYYITYLQILENERKLRFKNAVLFAAQNVNVNLKDLLPTQQNYDNDVELSSFLDIVDQDFEMDVIPNDTVPILTYLGGFAARQVLRKSRCDICSSWLQLNKEVEVDLSYDFLKDLDRGKLTLPTDKVVFIVGLAWHTMSLLTKDYIQDFLSGGKQLSVAHKICSIKLLRSDMQNSECKCFHKKTLMDKLDSVALCVNKILINNLVNNNNDQSCASKDTSRKVKKLKT